MSDAAAAAKTLQAQAAERFRNRDLEGAAEALSRAAALDPQAAEYRINLAELARARGDADAAAAHLGDAGAIVAAAPEPRTLHLLTAAWLDLGRSNEALEAAATAVGLADGLESRRLFVEAFKGATRLRAEHRGLVARAVSEAWTRVEGIQRPAANLLRAAWPQTVTALASDPLLAALLVSGVVRDADLERRLTALRRTLLLEPLGAERLPLLARLAMQCFINEYAWAQDEVETATAHALWRQLSAAGTRDAEVLLRAACYAPLHELDDAAALLAQDWPPVVRAVLQQQVAEPRAERAEIERLAAITSIRDGVSTAVRGQYEANPYPRWTKAPAQEARPLAEVMRARFPRAAMAPVPGAAAPQVLIAGCGTGQQAVQAAGAYRGATVLAVDLSLASLGYAARMSRELGLSNITFAQADLLELDRLGRSFDVIECSGVLHHLADPFEGAATLSKLLRPGGLMSIGVYSAVARRPLGPAKRLAQGFPPSIEGIRALRRAILDAPKDDPVRQVLGFGDFFAASTCRDLLMHVQEHELGTGDLRRVIGENGLTLLGFTVPPTVLAAYLRAYPDDPAATDLDHWAVFEAARPETFVAMYQVWTQRPAES